MHPPNYHKNEYAKSRCWSCSHPEMLIPLAEDEKEARRLLDEGYLSVSNKYRMVAKFDIPSVEELVQPQWKGTTMWNEVADFLSRSQEHLTRMYGEQIEVSPQVFIAFKKLQQIRP